MWGGWAEVWDEAEILPGLGRACDDWVALSLGRRPSGGHPHSCLPSASSGFESTERQAGRRKRHKQLDHSNLTAKIILHVKQQGNCYKAVCVCGKKKKNSF